MVSKLESRQCTHRHRATVSSATVSTRRRLVPRNAELFPPANSEIWLKSRASTFRTGVTGCTRTPSSFLGPRPASLSSPATRVSSLLLSLVRFDAILRLAKTLPFRPHGQLSPSHAPLPPDCTFRHSLIVHCDCDADEGVCTPNFDHFRSFSNAHSLDGNMTRNQARPPEFLGAEAGGGRPNSLAQPKVVLLVTNHPLLSLRDVLGIDPSLLNRLERRARRTYLPTLVESWVGKIYLILSVLALRGIDNETDGHGLKIHLLPGNLEESLRAWLASVIFFVRTA